MDELHSQLSRAQLDMLGERLRSLGGEVVAAAVFGSAARGELQASSDIDLLVVAGGLSTFEAQAYFKPVGRWLGRPVNLVVFSPAGWRNACGNGNPFPQNILARPLIPLAGKLYGLGKQVL